MKLIYIFSLLFIFSSNVFSKDVFYQDCINVDLPEDARHTISVLLELLKANDCLDANYKLKNLISLDISNREISNLLPLRNLRIKKINISDNEELTYEQLKILVSMPKLEEVIANAIELKIVNVFSKMINLKKLSVGYNQIFDISSLENLNLEQLFAPYNNIQDVSPLKDMSFMKKLDIYRNPIIKDQNHCPYKEINNIYLSNFCKNLLGE